MLSNTGRQTASFEAVLSSLRRERADHRVVGAAPLANPFFLGEGEPACGFAAAAELAFADFAPEQAQPAPLPSDSPDAIASELALADIATSAALQRARRRFMWANHPDRRRDWPRDLANRRVAIANMLIDKALDGLRRKL